jgi:hypothetical protein
MLLRGRGGHPREIEGKFHDYTKSATRRNQRLSDMASSMISSLEQKMFLNSFSKIEYASDYRVQRCLPSRPEQLARDHTLKANRMHHQQRLQQRLVADARANAATSKGDLFSLQRQTGAFGLVYSTRRETGGLLATAGAMVFALWPFSWTQRDIGKSHVSLSDCLACIK